MINYLKEKRKEDIKQALQLISRKFRLEILGKSGRPLYKNFWFLVEVPDNYPTELKEVFISKTVTYFGKILGKTKSETFFLVFLNEGEAKENIRSLISAILLISPRGKIIAFLSNKDSFKENLKLKESNSFSVGQAKFFLFNGLTETLSDNNEKARFFSIIKKYDENT